MNKKQLNALLVILLILFTGGVAVWHIQGKQLVSSMYDGTGSKILSGIIEGQGVHSLDYYNKIADKFMARVAAIGLNLVFLVYLFLRLLSSNAYEQARWKLIFTLPMLGLVVFSTGYYLNQQAAAWQAVVILLAPLVLLVAAVYLVEKGRHTVDGIARACALQSEAIDRLPGQNLNLWIMLAAAVTLYVELMIIRLHGSYFQLFAYFKNISLFSCFLGLGIGYARSTKKHVAMPLVMPFMAATIVAFLFVRNNLDKMLLQNPISEQWSLGLWSATGIIPIFTVYGFIILVFFANTLLFVPLGHLAGRLMSRQQKLVAYSWNLVGSLLGILVFTGLSFLWSSPTAWVAVALIGLYPFLRHHAASSIAAVTSSAIAFVALSLPWKPTEVDIFSPYQILTVEMTNRAHPVIKTSNAYFQKLLDLSAAMKNRNPETKAIADYYELPYAFISPTNVMVVGAGTGNDVAAALRRGAHSIDAVEIDPTIILLGKKLHPEQPYSDARVRVHENDARAFIKKTDLKYDLIVYGLLDSHTLLSGRSGGIRLDSYIYTVEALKEARDKLTDRGVLVLSFSILGQELGHKIFLMLEKAFEGQKPLVYRTAYDGGLTFVSARGDTIPSVKNADYEVINITSDYDDSVKTRVDVSTDDWPYFYMPLRKYPISYLTMVSILIVLSCSYILKLVPGSGAGFSFPCFFLGAGFMLVEAKGITELALVFGSTWVVISIVIVFILCMAFLANYLVLRGGSLSRPINYAAIAGALLLGWGLTHFGGEISINWFSRLFYSVLLTLPLFFSGFAFSSEVKRSSAITVALSSNIMGAMLGGFLEYNSMYFGFRFLYVLAFLMYLLAFITSFRGRTTQ